MNIGLPGAGVGGLFYLSCTLAMPFKELFLTLTKPGHKFRYKLVATQLSIAFGIVGGLFLVYKLVSGLFGLSFSSMGLVSGEGAWLYSLLPIFVSFGLLVVILSLLELFAFFMKSQKKPKLGK